MDFEEELRQMEFKSMEEFHRPNSKNVVWKLAGDDLKAILAAHNKAVREARREEINVLMDENDWVLDDTRTVEVPMDYLQKRLAELEPTNE